MSVGLSTKNFLSSIPSIPKPLHSLATFPADTFLFQPPPFLHPDSTPPKRPWIFIGIIAQPLWFVQKSDIAGTPGDEAAHIHIDNLGLPSWQVSSMIGLHWFTKLAGFFKHQAGRFLQTPFYDWTGSSSQVNHFI